MKSIKRLCLYSVLGVWMILCFSMPAAAKDYKYFDFNYVYQDWSGSNTSCYCTKLDDSMGIVNTLASNTGYVTGNRDINVQIVRGSDEIRAAIKTVNGMTRASIPYNVIPASSLIYQEMYLGVSTRYSYGDATRIKGSWSADT